MPTATKKRTAKRSRKGRRAASGLGHDGALGDGQPGDEGGEGERDPEEPRPDPGQGQRGGDRDHEEVVVLLAQQPEDAGEEPGGGHGDRGEDDETPELERGRTIGEADRGQHDAGQDDPGEVLEHTPTEQRLLGGAAGWCGDGCG